MSNFSKNKFLGWSRDERGIAVFFSDGKLYQKAKAGKASEDANLAYRHFELLSESDEASTQSARNGIRLLADDAVRLDSETRESLFLPPSWPGSLILETSSVPNLNNFAANLVLGFSGIQIDDWVLWGGILEANGEFYLPDAPTYASLTAFQQWQNLEDRSESDHWHLIHTLAEAAKCGCSVNIRGINKIDVTVGEGIGIDVRDHADGSLFLTPVPILKGLPSLLGKSKGEPLNEEDYVKAVSERLEHLDSGSKESIIRIGATIVLLDEELTKQARTLAKNKRVPSSQVGAFRKNPEKWLAKNVFVHGEVEFLPRVIGIGEWKSAYLGAAGELGEEIDWFNQKSEPEKEKSSEKKEVGEPTDAESEVQKEETATSEIAVPLIKDNERELDWGNRRESAIPEKHLRISPDFDIYPRRPFQHQIEAVTWLGEQARRCGMPEKWREGQTFWGAGALLADDMGLGKTLSTLVFLREWLRAWEAETAELPPACLIVCPLSLIDNWADEISKTYGEKLNPFGRVVRAISNADLRSYYATPNGKDIVHSQDEDIQGEVEKYGLMFGQKNEDSLDQPGTIVLTTYDTLRNHRFSFAGCDWSVLVLDEAQNIKNPNALQTIAAKALKAFFRIALSGTPVENHLGDLWSLMDGTEPGALGSFVEFRQRWIVEMRKNPEKSNEIGKALREHLGDLILRRDKETTLEGIPKKFEHKVEIQMPKRQSQLYDEILRSAGLDKSEEQNGQKTNQHLALMWDLRRVSLHPHLLGNALPNRVVSKQSSRIFFAESGKLKWLLEQLDDIRQEGEKVLVFAVQKHFQELLRRHLAEIYDLKISVINGDTKAVSKRYPNKTRLGLLEEFSESDGFGICILSPIAAGTGLNITAANHVIHLERHWNPAKEAQATDRAYRIGQEKEVHVYLPLLHHPTRQITTFDLGLNALLKQKKNLAGSLGLVPQQSVKTNELFDSVFRDDGRTSEDPPRWLTPADVAGLSGELLEALIACLYSDSADDVILTGKSGDHGADLVVMNHKKRGNILIQVKMTSAKKLDSEQGIRELEGAKRYYEDRLGVEFNSMCLHTNVTDFSKRTRKAARLYETELCGMSWLKKQLANTPVNYAELILQNTQRAAV